MPALISKPLHQLVQPVDDSACGLVKNETAIRAWSLHTVTHPRHRRHSPPDRRVHLTPAGIETRDSNWMMTMYLPWAVSHSARVRLHFAPHTMTLLRWTWRKTASIYLSLYVKYIIRAKICKRLKYESFFFIQTGPKKYWAHFRHNCFWRVTNWQRGILRENEEEDRTLLARLKPP